MNTGQNADESAGYFVSTFLRSGACRIWKRVSEFWGIDKEKGEEMKRRNSGSGSGSRSGSGSGKMEDE